MKAIFSRPLLIIQSLIICLSACSVSGTEPEVAEENNGESVHIFNPYIPGIVTVQFDDAMTARVEEALAGGDGVATKAFGGVVLQELGVSSLRRVFPYAGEYEPRTRKEGLHRFYYVTFDRSVPVTKASAGLQDIPGVVRVTPQLPVHMRGFNDPYFSQQWHLANSRYKDCDINVSKVWEQFTVGSSKVIVSVVDEGVNMTHEDLAANLIPCLEDGTGSYNFNNDTPTVVPTQGHGSHVAGVIAAVSNNGKGVAGVAGGDAEKGIGGVKVMSCQIFDLYGAPPDLFQAIKHGADHGAVILQCSWGFSPDMDGDGFTTEEEIELYRSYTIDDLPEYKAALDYFMKYAGCDNDGNQLPDSPMKGGVAIFAAGNDNFDYDPLVSYEPLIAVGAFGATGNKASYSNYGEWLDIAAPGGDGKQGIWSTLLGNSYGGNDWVGTSMACPHVSGVAALLVSYFGGPGFTAEECRTRLLRGAVANFFSGTKYIGRKLDAYGAFTFDLNTPIVPPQIAWVGQPKAELHYNETVELELTVSDPNGQRVHLEINPAAPGVSVAEGNRIRVSASEMGVGQHSFTVVAINEDKATASVSHTVSVLGNQSPVASDKMPEGVVLDGPSAEVSLPLKTWFIDPDDDAINVSASLLHPELAKLSVNEDGSLSVSALVSGVSELILEAEAAGQTTTVRLPFMIRIPGQPAFVYPSSAVEYVGVAIDSADPVTVSLKVYSSSGALVQKDSRECDIYHPYYMSLRKLAPGPYNLVVEYSGSKHVLHFNRR
jgi:subtilisin family serine protease